jgi:hypothetical protein
MQFRYASDTRPRFAACPTTGLSFPTTMKITPRDMHPGAKEE